MGPAIFHHALVGLDQCAQLVVAADERRAQPRQPAVLLGHIADDALGGPRGDAPDALRFDLARAAVRDATGGQALREVAHDDLAGSRTLLETRRRVHGGTGHEKLRRVARAGHGLTAVDTDPNPERGSVHIVGARQPIAQRERGTHGTVRIVIVRRRDAEDGHDRIADELLDRATVRPEDLARGLERLAE